MDVRNAFLNDILQETVYISAPLGFRNAIHPSFVCKLDKALYDLKQTLVFGSINLVFSFLIKGLSLVMLIPHFLFLNKELTLLFFSCMWMA